jgi:hypothetical protein
MLSDRSGEEAHEKFTNMLASLKGENEKVNFIFCVVCKDIVAVSFIGGGNWSTRSKPQTCRNFIT